MAPDLGFASLILNLSTTLFGAFFYLKGVVQSLLDRLGVAGLKYAKTKNNSLPRC